MTAPLDLTAVLNRYRHELFGSVVPFWLQHAVDRQHGGLHSCIGDDGVVQSTDKYMWSQLRGLWTFSALYNRMQGSAARHEGWLGQAGTDPQAWLDVAHGIYRFVSQHGQDEQGRWVFARQGDGAPHTGYTSIYTDGFALLGLTEYARATGNDDALASALATFKRVRALLAAPGSYPSDPYPLPEGVQAHGVAMIFSLAFFELALLSGQADVMNAALEEAEKVMGLFRRPQERYVLEFLDASGEPMDSPRGRAIVPGHAIESMWFMLHIYQHVGNEQRMAEAIECIRWHTELGWDAEHGGLLLARDAAGGEAWWPFANSKLWWPQTEAMYALLLAHELSGEAWCLDWFRRVDEYAFAHYPVPQHGEWTQRLDRYGRKFTETVALPVKDPFHLPRALLLSVEVLERLTGEQGAAEL